MYRVCCNVCKKIPSHNQRMKLLVCDLFCGGGGFSLGATQAGAEVVLAIESDREIARVYSQNFDHSPRVEVLGGDAEGLVRELVVHREHLHLHGSPPCTRLSQVNQTTRDATEGLRLVRWYLDLVREVQPRTWSMEQVAHPFLSDLLKEQQIHFTVVDMVDFRLPQHRRRLIAGSACIVAALEGRRGTGPTILPKDVLVSLQPASQFMLTNGTTNQPVKVRRDGVRVTLGHRRMSDGEGGRDLYKPCHTVWSKPGRVYDSVSGKTVRRLTPSECSLLQGCPLGFKLDEKSTARSYQIIGNMLPPPLARCIVCAAGLVADPPLITYAG
jgi:site-specific DNA-cytosine methylase